MKGIWLLVAVVAGAVVGVGVARWRPAPAGSSTAGSSTAPSPAIPDIRSRAIPDIEICPQVVVTCNDGTLAPTPCECRNRGGVKSYGAGVHLV